MSDCKRHGVQDEWDEWRMEGPKAPCTCSFDEFNSRTNRFIATVLVWIVLGLSGLWVILRYWAPSFMRMGGAGVSPGTDHRRLILVRFWPLFLESSPRKQLETKNRRLSRGVMHEPIQIKSPSLDLSRSRRSGRPLVGSREVLQGVDD